MKKGTQRGKLNLHHYYPWALARNVIRMDSSLSVPVRSYGLNKAMSIYSQGTCSKMAALPVAWMPSSNLHVVHEQSEIWTSLSHSFTMQGRLTSYSSQVSRVLQPLHKHRDINGRTGGHDRVM